MTDRLEAGPSPWPACNELAWTDALLVDSADGASEALGFVEALRGDGDYPQTIFVGGKRE